MFCPKYAFQMLIPNVFLLDPCFSMKCKPYETCVIKADDMTKCGECKELALKRELQAKSKVFHSDCN